MAVNPKYSRAILSGEKRVEFRRNGVPSDIKTIVLYSTKPDQKILGYCDVKGCIVDAPDKLWQNYGKFGFITRRDFKKYYNGYEVGKCFILDNPKKFCNPIPINRCKTLSTAPQSFAYLEKNEWRNFRRRKKANQEMHRHNESHHKY